MNDNYLKIHIIVTFWLKINLFYLIPTFSNIFVIVFEFCIKKDILIIAFSTVTSIKTSYDIDMSQEI